MTKKYIPSKVPFPSSTTDIDELIRLSGVSLLSAANEDATKKVINKILEKKSVTSDDDDIQLHNYQERFCALHKKYGRPFFLFLTDLLDVLLTPQLQEKLELELIKEKIKKKDTSINTLNPVTVSGQITIPNFENKINIGGEPVISLHHFLKRKNLLASTFLEKEEYPYFKKIMKYLDEIIQIESKSQFLDITPEKAESIIDEICDNLKLEISRDGIINLWKILHTTQFTLIEKVFLKTKDIGFIKPTYYEDLDKAYRDGKKLLKLLIAEFTEEQPLTNEKRNYILEYLKNILEIYTHHHFVLKTNHRTRIGVSRKEFEQQIKDLQNKIDILRKEAQQVRDAYQKVIEERDLLISEKRALETENQELKVKLAKLDPAEVNKQIRAMESKVNAIVKENQLILEEDAELRSALRKLDQENQNLLQKLRELNAIPDENAKSVEGLLTGKRVVIFGGVGRDHYWPLLKEAGVKEEDYEWYEGYHTISQARTSEICRRCDIVVVITAYAGHLLLWQTRECVKPPQHLFLIHKSGAGSLRQHIIEKFKKND